MLPLHSPHATHGNAGSQEGKKTGRGWFSVEGNGGIRRHGLRDITPWHDDRGRRLQRLRHPGCQVAAGSTIITGDKARRVFPCALFVHHPRHRHRLCVSCHITRHGVRRHTCVPLQRQRQQHCNEQQKSRMRSSHKRNITGNSNACQFTQRCNISTSALRPALLFGQGHKELRQFFRQSLDTVDHRVLLAKNILHILVGA